MYYSDLIDASTDLLIQNYYFFSHLVTINKDTSQLVISEDDTYYVNFVDT